MKPSDLFVAIDSVTPRHSNLVQGHETAGLYNIKPDAMQFASRDAWEDLPRLPWDQILHYWQMFDMK